MAEKDKEKPTINKWLIVVMVVVAVSGAIGVANMPGSDEFEEKLKQASSSSQSAGPVSKALVTGQMKNFVLKADLPAVPEVAFKNADGKDLKISDWKGRVVLLNLWATWCAPCRHEMPSFNRLQTELGSDQFEVVALSVDRKGLPASAKFLKETGASALKLYNDKSSDSLQHLKVIGLPATLLIDRQGREIGRLLGPAEWDAAEAKALIMTAVNNK